MGEWFSILNDSLFSFTLLDYFRFKCWVIIYLSVVNWDNFFSFQCTELEECWCQHRKKPKPLLWSHHVQSQSTMLKKKARMGDQAEGGGSGVNGGWVGRVEGREDSLLDRKRQRQQNKGWEAMCLLSTNKHTTKGDLCRLKDKGSARSNNYEVATVK